MNNPYAISFGRIPTKYINRSMMIDDIIDSLTSEEVGEQAFKITGIRGMGKTVTLTAIEKRLRDLDDWIVVDIRPDSNILSDLVANLYSAVPFVTEFVDTSLNLSYFGIGLSVHKKSPVASIDYAIKKIFEIIKKQNKKVLVAIDEARKNESMIDFIQEFQILIREEMPIYLIAAGLYEDIEALENSDGLTFFLRAQKIEMTPLNLTVIRADYEKTLGVERGVAEEMALITKGYPFAFQALGKFMWESETRELDDVVLALLDEALAEKVYNKIWTELTDRDKFFLSFILTKDKMQASELLEMTKKTHSEWSEPRKRLSNKGIIDTRTRGVITVRLPRLKEFYEMWV